MTDEERYKKTYERIMNAKSKKVKYGVDVSSSEFLGSISDRHLAGLAQGNDLSGPRPEAVKAWKERKGNKNPQRFINESNESYYQDRLENQKKKRAYAEKNKRKYKKYKKAVLRDAQRRVGIKEDWRKFGIPEQDVISHFYAGIPPEELGWRGKYFYDA